MRKITHFSKSQFAQATFNEQLFKGQEGDMAFINHHIVSRRHAMITYANGCYLLRALGSRNGTFLNEKRLEPYSVHILHPHDKIRIGTVTSYSLQFRLLDRIGETFIIQKWVILRKIWARSVSYTSIEPEVY